MQGARESSEEDAGAFTAYNKVKSRLDEWGNKVEVCIIDIDTPYGEILPGKIDCQIMQALEAFLEFQSQNHPQYVIIICQYIPPDGETLRKRILNKNIKDGRLAIVDENGNYVAKFKIGPNYDRNQFNLRLINAKDRYEDLLQKKK